MAILPVLPQHDIHDKIVEEAIEAVLSTVDLEAVLERTGRLLNDRFGTTRVAIHRLRADQPGKAQVALVSDPRHLDARLGDWFDLDGSLTGAALAEKRPVVVDPIDAARPRYREEPWLAELGYGSVVSFPLLFEDEALGALDIAHPPREGLLDCCFQVARQVAHLVAIALHNSLMVDEVRRLNRLLDRENTLLKDEIRQLKRDARYVAESAAMRAVLERVRLVAPSDTTVLVRGETGTGKEGLARMVHDLSPRFGAPFVTVNLGALPETLIESELFGHEKGAFTGASRRRQGKFEQAEGGTLFLDEVGDAPPAVQVRLLRVLQEREVERVGGREPVKVNVRVVAATNRNLEAMVAEGTFRSDLYYRLSVFPLQLPPLRERREDVRPLVPYFLQRQAALMHRKAPAVSEATWAALEGHRWPGNVRELEHALERALLLARGDALTVADLPPELAKGAAPAEADHGEGGYRHARDAWEKRYFQELLDEAGGSMTKAAELAGLHRSTLYEKLARTGLVQGEPEGGSAGKRLPKTS
jgi:formate hydrogenlyase transcriptional activator